LREVVSNSGSNTQNLGKICTYYIRPVNVQTTSYVKDTAHVLRRIKELNDKGPQPPGTFPFTMDIVAMYPSVPVQASLGVLRKALLDFGYKADLVDWLIKAMGCVLTSNTFEWDGELRTH
jgi:hypothetical protein